MKTKSAHSRTENISGASRIQAKLATAAKRFNLTRREFQTLHCLAIGKTHKASACRLEISHRTVEFHSRNLLRKIGAENPAHALAKIFGL